jgi:hypothetical protein
MAVEDDKKLVGDYPGHPSRLVPVLALWDVSRDWLMWRLEGVTDDEWLWEPGPRARPIAWTATHLAEMGLARSDWTDGSRSAGKLPPATTPEEGLPLLRRGLDAWRETLGRLAEGDLDTVGLSQYPRGFDVEVPILDVAWWMARELVHHASDIGTVRDLYPRQ